MKPITTGLDNVVTAIETPIRPKKLSLRVSGTRLGSVVRPVPTAEELATGVAMAGAVAAPRFGLRVRNARLVPAGPMSPDDYATAEDYE